MTQAVAEYQASELTLPDHAYVERELRSVRDFQTLVHTLLVSGHDYGPIPGTAKPGVPAKPILLKPGAEKIAKLLGLSDHYEVVDSVEDWDRPLFRYLVRCELRHIGSGRLVADCLGECNTMEARYRWRHTQRACPICGAETIFESKPPQTGFYCWVNRGGCGAKFLADEKRIISQSVGRVLNEDVFSLVNTVLKMAQKRALVGAALSAGRLSDVFTQDMEDLQPSIAGDYAELQPTSQRAQPKQPQQAASPTPTQRTHAQNNAIWKTAREFGWSNEQVHRHIETTWDLTSTKGLTVSQADELIEYINAGNQPAAPPEKDGQPIDSA